MNKKHLLPAAIILCTSLLSAGFLFNPRENNPGKHLNILMRDIGHKVLLAAGDSTSRVMPVKQPEENTYQVSFEEALTFEPDTLVKIVSTIMARDGFTSPYLVYMIDCNNSEIIYGYEIGNGKQDIVPCRARVQPRACYTLEITLLDTKQASTGLIPSLGILTAGTLLVLGLIFFKPQRKDETLQPNNFNVKEQQHFAGIGSYQFNSEKGLLRYEGNVVELSMKETRVLSLLSQEINTTVLREKLNEIWADEGVITGRSLDVFVSKLRKRFTNDPSIRIINVHGKGYRLEVASGVVRTDPGS